MTYLNDSEEQTELGSSLGVAGNFIFIFSAPRVTINQDPARLRPNFLLHCNKRHQYDISLILDEVEAAEMYPPPHTAVQLLASADFERRHAANSLVFANKFFVCRHLMGLVGFR